MPKIKKLTSSTPYVIRGLPDDANYWMLLLHKYRIRDITDLVLFGTEAGGTTMRTMVEDLERVTAVALELCVNKIFRTIDIRTLRAAASYLLKANRSFPISRGHRVGLSFTVKCLEELLYNTQTPWDRYAEEYVPELVQYNCELFGTYESQSVSRLYYPNCEDFNMVSEPYDFTRLNKFMEDNFDAIIRLESSPRYQKALERGERWLSLRMKPFWQRMKALE